MIKEESELDLFSDLANGINVIILLYSFLNNAELDEEEETELNFEKESISNKEEGQHIKLVKLKTFIMKKETTKSIPLNVKQIFGEIVKNTVEEAEGTIIVSKLSDYFFMLYNKMADVVRIAIKKIEESNPELKS